MLKKSLKVELPILKKHAPENPEDDLEILFYEQEGFSWKANASAFFREANHR